MDKKIISAILNYRWQLKNRKIPRYKWRHIIFEYLWNKDLLKNKPTDTFSHCWNYLVEQDLI